MSKSRDNKHRRQRAARKMDEYRRKNAPPHAIPVPVEIVAVKGEIPKLRG